MHPISRRRLLGAGAALAALAGPGCAGVAAAPRERRVAGTPWFRISLAQWSFHRALRDGSLAHLDFARHARDAYGIEGVEYVNSFFKDKARDWGYLAEMRRRADDAGVRSLLIMVDGEGALGAESFPERSRAISNHGRWIEAAAALGCRAIRVNAAGTGDPLEMQKRTADSLVALADHGANPGLNVIVENHGGLSSDGAWLAGVMRRANHPRVGTLPDFGNFRIDAEREYDRYRGVRELMPFAKAVSAKSHDFDAAGNERHTDYARMLRIVKDAGYRAWIGIEYEGEEVSEDEGVRRTLELLVRVRGETA